MNFLILNGPNMDMLGTRDPATYGKGTLAELEAYVKVYAEAQGHFAACFQSNHEGVLIDVIHAAPARFDGIVFNPGAYTHYSYALRDAVDAVPIPVVETHISDIHARAAAGEAFRGISVIEPACIAQISGMGWESYCRALDVLVESVTSSRSVCHG